MLLPSLLARLAIILSAVGDFSSTKVKLKNAHLFKEHTLRAIELAPDDTTLHHMMGRWCYEVASMCCVACRLPGLVWLPLTCCCLWACFPDVSWTTRMAAKAFGSVPDATHDDALHHFEESRRLKVTCDDCLCLNHHSPAAAAAAVGDMPSPAG